MRVVFPTMETFHFHKAFYGGNKFTYYLTKELIKKGIDVTVVCTKLEGYPDKMTDEGIDYVFLPPEYTGKDRFLNIPYKFVFSKNLKKYLETIDFDILHSAESFAWSYLHKKERKPVIFQCWAMEAWYGKETLRQKGLRKLYVNLFLKKPWQYVLDHSDSIASDGEFQLPKLTKIGMPKEKAFFIPNGVNFKEIQEKKKKYKDQRKELGLKENELLVLSVCQIAPDKGIMDIINGFALFKKKVNNSKLLMIGKGVLEQEMHILIRRLGLENDIIYMKNVPEDMLYNYYFSSDVFISASTSNEFMINILEAMSCGLPIVSSAQPFLIKDGVNGYVVGVENPEGIRDGLLKIYNQESMKEMGNKSLEMVKEYDYDHLADIAIKEYKRLKELVE